MSNLSIHNDLDEYSLRFLQTGSCEQNDYYYNNTDAYDPFLDGCKQCNAEPEFIQEDTSQGFVICTKCGIALRTQILINRRYWDPDGGIDYRCALTSIFNIFDCFRCQTREVPTVQNIRFYMKARNTLSMGCFRMN